MKVTLINPDRVEELYDTWTKFAATCYNTKITEKNKELIGKGCHNTGHYSGSRTTYFIFHIEGVSRAMTAQLNRTSIGCVINEKSMRYVDFSNAEFTIPPSIQNNPKALETYQNITNQSKIAYKEIQDALSEDGINGEQNNQDARYALPLGIQTEGVWAFTIEALEHLCNKRICERSQWEIRQCVGSMRDEVLEVLPALKTKLVSDCIRLGYCPENKMQCAKYKKVIPTKQQFNEIRMTDAWKQLVKEIKAN